MTFGQGLSDLTGFAQDGREFAVVGLVEDVAAFVDITDPTKPYEIEKISGSSNTWRDLKYWNRHVYIGTEAGGGVRVFSVDDPDNPLLVYTITDFGSSHNIYIDGDGFLYVVGTQGHDLWIYDLTNPELPELIGTWDGEYLHDIDVYNNKIYGAGIYTGYFYIIDANDRTNPKTLVKHYTGLDGVSTHDCAVTYDEKHLITGDETRGGHLKIWDISDYGNINLISEYMTDYQHSLHNIYIRPGTNLVIMSYYVDGTRVLDISNPEDPIEVGYYDTTNLTGLYDGNWGTFAYLPSGYIISSDRQNGLYILNSPLSDPGMSWSDCDPNNMNWYGDYDPLEMSILDSLVILNPNLEDYEYNDYVKFNAGKVVSIDISTKGLFSLNLPSNFASLINLELLNIENNYLTQIPDRLCDLQEDCVVNISKNRLCENDLSTNGNCIDTVGYQHCSECNSGYWFEGYCLNKNDIVFLEDLIEINESLLGVNIFNVGIAIPGLSNWYAGNLIRLDVSSHSIATLPTSIGNLGFLEELNLKNNFISKLPDSFSEMNSLLVLKLHNNKIDQLPDNFGNLFMLKELYLPGNLLTSIPGSIGDLQSLDKLYLQNNYLFNLPISFCNLPATCITKLDNNCLKGPFSCNFSTGQQNDCGGCDDSLSCLDCAGVPNGSAYVDNCDTCDDDPSNDCEQDCTGNWGGDILEDDCGVCGGANADLDDCGVCFGNNSDNLGCGCFEPGPSGCDNICGSTLVDDDCDSLSVERDQMIGFELFNPLPNPFNTYVELSFILSQAGFVNMQIFDLEGRLIDTLVNNWSDKGSYSIIWDSNNLSSGIYFVKISLNDQFKLNRMILLK